MHDFDTVLSNEIALKPPALLFKACFIQKKRIGHGIERDLALSLALFHLPAPDVDHFFSESNLRGLTVLVISLMHDFDIEFKVTVLVLSGLTYKEHNIS